MYQDMVVASNCGQKTLMIPMSIKHMSYLKQISKSKPFLDSLQLFCFKAA